MLRPLSGKILVEPILRSEVEAAAVKSRSGLFIPPPDNKLNSFEGMPNEGRVYALPDDYDGELKVGDHVIFSEMTPKGFKHDGKKLFPLELKQIVATINEAPDA